MQFFMESDSPGSVLRFNSLLFEVLFQLYQNFSFHASAPSKDTARRNRNLEKITPVLNYIRENYNRLIPLSEIADIAALQPKYFCRFFKKCMGVTFLEYQNEIRLSYIYNDLISTDDPLALLLDRHGFSNYKLFRRIFRERFQCTPMELRKERIETH
ncbi:AraC family transcriptional regulator [uncultured Ruminococcus sp.]|uniref:AraC family transcriptional regulator n=1 Tax=uncultured Ruminococcus sp. TaxID=165186 RepID=UPI00345310AE